VSAVPAVGLPGARAGDMPDASQPVVAAWLFACAALVMGVLIVGGITRLTHSGLSIVQWRPLTGVLPPLSEGDWAALFDQYRASPEFQQVNRGMDLAGFKPIFWWEYAHRLLGRVAGLAFLLPLAWFAASRRIARPLFLRLSMIFALGALQGALGWYMVASGLVDDPRVSPVRLSAHLAMALLLIGLLLWTAWTVAGTGLPRRPVPVTARLAVGAVFLMAMSGALVAGTHAGLAFNTFPRMEGQWVPDGLFALDPWYENFLANLATVQFLHRAIALLVVLAILLAAWTLRASAAAASVRRLLVPALALQLGLGVATLLSHVNITLAAAHQASAVLLFASALHVAFRAGAADAGGARQFRPA